MCTTGGMDISNLKRLLQEHNTTQAELARLLGRDRAVITNLMYGRRRLKAEEAMSIANYLNVSVAEVLGVEEAHGLKEATSIPFRQEPSRQIRKRRSVVKRDGRYYLEEQNVRSDSVCAFEVGDNSMSLAGMMEGDIVIADMQANVKSGDLVVVQHYQGGGARTLIRRYHPPLLMAYSSDGATEPLSEHDEQVRIVSPVIKLIRLF